VARAAKTGGISGDAIGTGYVRRLSRWIGSDRFDVEGKAENPRADPDQLRLMLQSLLEDRFQLKLHRENKQAPIYALVVAKDGPQN
jgi:uncharacterized protein (TIGR03435 family)